MMDKCSGGCGAPVENFLAYCDDCNEFSMLNQQRRKRMEEITRQLINREYEIIEDFCFKTLSVEALENLLWRTLNEMDRRETAKPSETKEQ
jgi:hypothetical protein